MFIWIQDTYGQYPDHWENKTSNWVQLPATTRETTYIITSYVNDSRNEYGAVIGQIVGRANIKMDNLEWKMKDIDTISMILNLTKPKKNSADVNERNFYFNMRVPNLFRTGSFLELTAYSGDATVKPYWLTKNGKNIKVADIKVNLIDCGLASFIGDLNASS